MTPKRKDAYRHLLYCMHLEIRRGRRHLRWWSPPDWLYAFRTLPQNKIIANDFHNLAFFSREDFRNFDEQIFWDRFQQLSPEFHVRYRRAFEGYLRGEYLMT
jgi:hypothetical protein